MTRGRGYELQLPDEESVDAVRFERLFDTRPRDALALWRGPPLAELADEPFAPAEIAAWRSSSCGGRAARSTPSSPRGATPSWSASSSSSPSEHPWRERLHAQLMLALYRSGRQADALEAYRRAREVLVEQLGIEPGPELHDLQQAILAQDPALDAPAVAAGPSAARGRRCPIPRRH